MKGYASMSYNRTRKKFCEASLTKGAYNDQTDQQINNINGCQQQHLNERICLYVLQQD